MYKPKRIIEWLILNGLMMAITIYALFYSSVWATNVIKFALWFFTVQSLALAFNKDSKKRKQLQGKPVPDLLASSHDIALAFLLAAFGWFFYATLAIVQGVLYFVIYTPNEKDVEATNDK